MLSQTPGRHALLRLAGTLSAIAGLLCAFSFTTRAAEICTTTETVLTAGDEKNVSFIIADNQDGKPLSGTLIQIEGTTRGTVTDDKGFAEIEAAPGSTMQITLVGYDTKEVHVSEDNEPIRYILMMERSEAPDREQTATPDNDEDTVLVAEQMPTFQGGDLNTFRNWVQEGLRYPQGALDAGIQGRVVLTFVVEKDGSIGEVHTLMSPDEQLSGEAVRVVRSASGLWTPGEQRGEKVRLKYTIPIDFRLDATEAPAGEPQPATPATGTIG